MRHTFTLAAVMLGAAPGAIAADMPAKAPAAAYHWAGAYVGAHAGYGWRPVTVSERFDLVSGTSPGPRFSFDTAGGIGGLQAGYNALLTPRLVVGIEADMTLSNVSGSTFIPNTGTSIIRTHSNVPWFATARGRLGYAGDNVLVYATGGLAWINAERQREQIAGTTNLATPGTVDTGSWSKLGWTAGGGAEVGVTARSSVKAEYLYLTSFDRLVFFPPRAQIRSVQELQLHTVRFGVNYRY